MRWVFEAIRKTLPSQMDRVRLDIGVNLSRHSFTVMSRARRVEVVSRSSSPNNRITSAISCDRSSSEIDHLLAFREDR
jgi:hypothetical protein